MIRRKIPDISKKRLAFDLGILVVCYSYPVLSRCGLAAVECRNGTSECDYDMFFVTAKLAFVILFGGLAFAFHFPEIFAPQGTLLDFVGNSHQIMHVMAYAAHYYEWQFMDLLSRPASHIVSYDVFVRQ
eukprot:CAMPEP_0174885060 /NCGR_PEP_ID=MMETSP0167-20121228/446_1 /TAXON_ID=38298 /ORGANISM="Rhodella maculata, Strain CCMP736" /LENGTH=128 /DNA_ID=CAMNT_0016120563 /DNA_START=451 /DNA_END=837 /DNA_ORIENTATION=+